MLKKYSATKLGNCIFAALNGQATGEFRSGAVRVKAHYKIRRGAGVVELARLESVYRRNPIKGSNPFPSASLIIAPAASAAGFLFRADGRACPIRMRKTKNEGGHRPPEGAMRKT